jgi:phosphatidylglycerophosphatase A
VTGSAQERPTVAWLRDPGHFLALGGGSGLAPFAPGTWGSAVGLALYAAVADLPVGVYAALVAGLFGLGIWACGRTAKALAMADPGVIVLDEVVGMMLTVTFCSTGIFGAILGFALFRGFDILKPWPVSLVDRRVGGGLGIMADDVVAAIYAMTCLEIIEYLSLSYKIIP